MDPTSNRADGANGVDSKALYRDLSMFLKDHYFPHYNIYQVYTLLLNHLMNENI